MATVGVIGLGHIGGAVAANLVADGHDVTVYDLSSERISAVAGARAASRVADLAAASEITFTSLPTSEVVATVAQGWAASATPGSVLVDLSTGDPEANRRLAARTVEAGHAFVEAPLTGGAVGARDRRLVFMVGGDDDAVARVRPVLDPLGRATFHLGPVGAGSTMKLVNSLLAFTATWSSLEGLSLAAASGVDLRDAVEVLRTAGASNFFVDRAVEGIGERGRPVQFALDLARKDADLVVGVAEERGVPAPVAAALAEVLADAVERGLGDHDWSDLVVAAEARAGQPLVLRPPPTGGGAG
jgi:3-hydroxyisobutyrate dehydrogenase-like beta-hydroxyacid dehydrogenase